MYLYPYSGKTGDEWAEEAAKVQRNWLDNTSITRQTAHEVTTTEMRVGRGKLLFRLRGADSLANATQSRLKGLLKGWSRKTLSLWLAKSSRICRFQVPQYKPPSVIVLGDLLNSFSVTMCRQNVLLTLPSPVLSPFILVVSGLEMSDGDIWFPRQGQSGKLSQSHMYWHHICSVVSKGLDISQAFALFLCSWCVGEKRGHTSKTEFGLRWSQISSQHEMVLVPV